MGQYIYVHTDPHIPYLRMPHFKDFTYKFLRMVIPGEGSKTLFVQLKVQACKKICESSQIILP